MKMRDKDGRYPPGIHEKVSRVAQAGGKEPVKLSMAEMGTLGHLKHSGASKSPRWRYQSEAIRAMCVDCMGGEGPLDAKGEIERCTSVGCPLWPYRFGKGPEAASVRDRLIEEDG